MSFPVEPDILKSVTNPVKLEPSPSKEPLNEPLCIRSVAFVVATILPVPFIGVVVKLPSAPVTTPDDRE